MNPSSVPKVLLLIEQIRPRATQVDDLRTAVPILLEACALPAVEGVRDAFSTTDNALVLVVAKGALVAYACQIRRPHIRVAGGAFAVALFAEAGDGDAGLLAAHYEIWVMARHGVWCSERVLLWISKSLWPFLVRVWTLLRIEVARLERVN